jgi:hypothetical protein
MKISPVTENFTETRTDLSDLSQFTRAMGPSNSRIVTELLNYEYDSQILLSLFNHGPRTTHNFTLLVSCPTLPRPRGRATHLFLTDC